MAEKTYSLYSDATFLDERLAVEIGDNYVVLVSGSAGQVSGLEYFSTEDTLEETMEDISHHSSLIKKNYSETKVFYNLKESVVVPVGQFNTSVAAEFVDLAFGVGPASRVNVENINVAPGIVNVYRSNEHWQDIISKYFRAVTKRHLYSRLVEEIIDRHIELKVIFYKGSMIVVAAKDQQLKLARRFDFTTPEDVLYHLLNVCKQVDLKPAEMPLYICGLINETDPAFRLLLPYFDVVMTDAKPSDVLPGSEKYPAHYFSSFINLLS